MNVALPPSLFSLQHSSHIRKLLNAAYYYYTVSIVFVSYSYTHLPFYRTRMTTYVQCVSGTEQSCVYVVSGDILRNGVLHTYYVRLLYYHCAQNSIRTNPTLLYRIQNCEIFSWTLINLKSDYPSRSNLQ